MKGLPVNEVCDGLMSIKFDLVLDYGMNGV